MAILGMILVRKPEGQFPNTKYCLVMISKLCDIVCRYGHTYPRNIPQMLVLTTLLGGAGRGMYHLTSPRDSTSNENQTLTLR